MPEAPPVTTATRPSMPLITAALYGLQRSRWRWPTGPPRRRAPLPATVRGGMARDYLEAILNANVYDVAIETPLARGAAASRERLGNRLLLKREDLQPVFSFKLRGAYNKMSRLAAGELARGVVAASAGNHAQGVALAAQRLGTRGDDRDAGDDAADQGRRGRGARRRRSCSRATRTTTPTPRRCASGAAARLTFVHPVRRPRRDRRPGHDRDGDPAPAAASRSTRSSSPVGGGGLIAGIAAYVKRLRPEIRDHRRRADGRGRDGALARGRPPGHAPARRPLRRRRRREAGRRGDVPARPHATSTR